MMFVWVRLPVKVNNSKSIGIGRSNQLKGGNDSFFFEYGWNTGTIKWKPVGLDSHFSVVKFIFSSVAFFMFAFFYLPFSNQLSLITTQFNIFVILSIVLHISYAFLSCSISFRLFYQMFYLFLTFIFFSMIAFNFHMFCFRTKKMFR